MAFPPGTWTVNLQGLYLRPDGSPHRGYVMFTPKPVSIGVEPASPATGARVLQSVQVPISSSGLVRCTLLNPNDPSISPGAASGWVWSYTVREVFRRGPVLEWMLLIPDDAGNGASVNLGAVQRRGEHVVRPTDWFPGHFTNHPLGPSANGHASGQIV